MEDNYEIRKKMYETYIKKNINENQNIYLPYNWRLEDNKLTFRMIIRVFTLSSGSKSICIDVDHINYNNKDDDNIYNTDILAHKIYPTSVESDTMVNYLSDFLTNFRNEYTFSKVLDKLILKKNKEEEEKVNLFLFSDADPYKETSCCVCNDISLTFTSCDHNLCRICFSSIETENENGCIGFWKKCPICRQKLNIYP